MPSSSKNNIQSDLMIDANDTLINYSWKSNGNISVYDGNINLG